MNDRDMIIDVKVRDKRFVPPVLASFIGKDAREKAIEYLKTKR